MAAREQGARWLARYRQRLAYVLIAAALVFTLFWVTLGGIRIHRAVLVERQSLRVQKLSQTALELQNVALAAEAALGVSPTLAAQRKRAVAAAEAAFADVAGHDAGQGGRLRIAFDVYLARSSAAFIAAGRNQGVPPNPLEQLVQRSLATFEQLVGVETSGLAAATERANPRAREALITGAAGAAVLILLLVWQFELERRAGRIDRDNAVRAEELARLRDEFVAVVSHELRTPLTSIVGYLELIEDDDTGNLTDEQRSYLAVVRRSTHRLGELVGDLLLVAEAERAPLSLEIGDVDVETLAAHAVEAAQPVADARGIELRLETTPGTLRGDPNRLAQMLDNLVSNALKFTPPGGVVTVRASIRDGWARLEVADTGHGISNSERARLFEPFYRAREATEHAVPGTGLGLTITKAIVDVHRGTIEVDSTPRTGTTFRVRLPQA